jgi:hypothetical protein
MNDALDAPITKAISLIRNFQVQHGYEMDVRVLDDLDYVINLLQSNDIFEPKLQTQGFEKDIGNWLEETMVRNNIPELSHRLIASPIFSLKRPSFNPSLSGVLDQIDSWDFNVFGLKIAGNGKKNII